MKRAPIVLAGTAIGLVGLVSYHTTTTGSVGLTAGLTGPASTASGATSTTGTTAGHSASAASGSSGSSGSSTSQSASASKTTSSQPVGPALTRSAVGHDIRYGYGDLAVKVTMLGSKITDISLARAQVVDQQSANIDQYVFPRLKQEALNAQGAKIQGISGASYTSQAYAESLQSAIDKLTTAHA